MAGDFEVRGAEDLRELNARIRSHADRKAIQRELYAGLNRATKGIRDDQKASIPASLPSRGGLASLVHGSARLSTRMRHSGASAGIRIQATDKQHDLARMNAGSLRHPVYGRGAWVTQTAGVDAGFLDEPVKKAGPDVARAILRVMADIARKVQS